MSWPSAIVLIVLIAAAAKVLRARYHSEAFLDRHGSEQRAAIERPERDYRRDDEAEAEISALKERIAVLERIAYMTANQFTVPAQHFKLFEAGFIKGTKIRDDINQAPRFC